MMTPEEQQQMAQDIREIKQAVLGNKSIGLNGLVDDMKAMKEFRDSIAIKVALVSGFVSASIIGGKALLAKLFGNS